MPGSVNEDGWRGGLVALDAFRDGEKIGLHGQWQKRRRKITRRRRRNVGVLDNNTRFLKW
jgi:hypothetical protein